MLPEVQLRVEESGVQSPGSNSFLYSNLMIFPSDLQANHQFRGQIMRPWFAPGIPKHKGHVRSSKLYILPGTPGYLFRAVFLVFLTSNLSAFGRQPTYESAAIWGQRSSRQLVTERLRLRSQKPSALKCPLLDGTFVRQKIYPCPGPSSPLLPSSIPCLCSQV